MVDRELSFSLIQLVALSLPAFAILLQIVVESDHPYTHLAVPVTTAGMGLFLGAGVLILAELLLTTASFVATVAIGVIVLGIVSLIVGGGLIGVQTRTRQRQLRQDD